jgi:hypothetical protein
MPAVSEIVLAVTLCTLLATGSLTDLRAELYATVPSVAGRPSGATMRRRHVWGKSVVGSKLKIVNQDCGEIGFFPRQSSDQLRPTIPLGCTLWVGSGAHNGNSG